MTSETQRSPSDATDSVRYLITGATGHVGGATCRALLRAGYAVRVASRNPSSPVTVREPDTPADTAPIESVYLDFETGEPDPSIFDGVTSLLLVRPPAISDIKRAIAPFLHAARENGVTRVVFLSVLGAHRIPVIPHHKIEREIKRLRFDADFLRASFFMQNLESTLGDWIADAGRIVVPAGGGRTSFVDTEDLGEAAAILLTRSAPHAVRGWDLTGPQALSHEDVARIMSEELGREIRYESPSRKEFIRRAVSRGWDAEYAAFVSRLYLTVRFSLSAGVTDELETILGRAPTDIRTYVRRRAARWKPE